MTDRCSVCRNEGRNRTCHPAEDAVSRANVAPTDPRVPADTSSVAPQSESLSGLVLPIGDGPWMRVQGIIEDMPTGRDRTQALIDMNAMLIEHRDALRAALDAPALTVERMREPLLAIGKELADYYDARCPDCSHEWRDHGPGGCSYRAKDEADMPCVCTEERGMTRG